jgi:hypothetical protein
MKKVLAAAGIGAALITTPVVVAETASADPGQNCRSEWNTMYNVPVGVRTTCFNPRRQLSRVHIPRDGR